MRKAISLLAVLILCAACARDDSLQGVFEAAMKDNQVDGYTILDLQETETLGLVLYESGSADEPGQPVDAGVHVFERSEGRWAQRPGTACTQTGVSTLGLFGNGYLYCAVLKDQMSFATVRVGDVEARIFQTRGGQSIWYAVGDSMEAPVVGVGADGREVPLN